MVRASQVITQWMLMALCYSHHDQNDDWSLCFMITYYILHLEDISIEGEKETWLTSRVWRQTGARIQVLP